MSTVSWYYALGEEQAGPLSALDLVQSHDRGELPGETYVWRDGMTDWVPLNQVLGELRASAGTISPPPPPALPTASMVSPYAAPDSFLAGKSSQAPAVDSGRNASPYGPYKSPRSRATAAIVLLSISMVVSLLMAVSSYMQLTLLSDFANGVYEGRQDEYMVVASANDQRVALIGVVFLLVFIGCVVTWCMWTHRVMRNAWSFANRYSWLETSPGWAVGWFFIPFACLWKPFGALSQAWRATVDPKGGAFLKAPGIMVAWWTVWVISNLLSNFSARMSLGAGDSMDELLTTTKLEMADQLITFAITPLAILVVMKLTKKQQERHEQTLTNA